MDDNYLSGALISRTRKNLVKFPNFPADKMQIFFAMNAFSQFPF